MDFAPRLLHALQVPKRAINLTILTIISLPHTTWLFKKSPDALHLLIPGLAQKRPESFYIAKYWPFTHIHTPFVHSNLLKVQSPCQVPCSVYPCLFLPFLLAITQ